MDQAAIDIMTDVKKYLEYIGNKITIEKVILFGSYAKGNASKESDIDLAIISPQFGKAPLLEKMELYESKFDADIKSDIQPVPIGSEEFVNEDNFFILEIKNTGIDISDFIHNP